MEQPNQKHNRTETAMDVVDDCICDSEEQDLSTRFLQMRRSQIIDLQEHFERYCNVLPVFGFNSAKFDLIIIKSFLLPILFNERDIEPTVIQKANQFVSFKSGDIHLLDIMNFLRGAKSLVQRNRATKNFLRMTHSLTFCATVTPLKKVTATLKTLLRGVCLKSKF